MKTYWPYIPMLLIVGLGLIVNTIWSHSGVLGAQSDFSAAALLTDTNQQRAADHEPNLKLNAQLAAAAQAKANDMAAKNYWSHNSPSGQTPWSFITAAGYHYEAAGENLAYGFNDSADVVSAWMNSPTHRANVLGSDYKDVGFGVVQAPNYQGKGPETIVVAEYGDPAGVTPAIVSTSGTGTSAANLAGSSKPVSRVQLMTGQQAWITAAVSALAGAAVMLFIVRHGLRFKRLVLEGEHFVAQHAFLDIALVFVGTLAIIFAQASGTIH
ncbi:MAG TPA: CAP domain-containing protein [Candidatus Saccharimonadales bacterium]|nr:CAP domain-containing protein [Candidatus Saccharimonadales bacterium]